MKTPTDDELRSMEEEDIHLTWVVQRLFDFKDQLAKQANDAESHWRDSIDAITSQFNQIIQEERKFMEQKQQDIQSLLDQHSKEVQVIMDNSMAKFSQRLDEYMGKVESDFNNLRNDVASKLDSSSTEFSTEQKNSNASAKKELEVVVNNAMGQVVGRFNEHKREIDNRFAGLESLIEKTAQKEVEKYFIDLTKTVNDGRDFIAEFKKDMADQITKYQSDSQLRVSGVNEKLETVLNKFRVIIKDL